MVEPQTGLEYLQQIKPARALFNDQSIIPVRGQLARAVPQPEVHYGLEYKSVGFLPRRDGLVFQVFGENDQIAVVGIASEPAPQADESLSVREHLQDRIREVLGRALCIRRVDACWCNGCEFEIHARAQHPTLQP